MRRLLVLCCTAALLALSGAPAAAATTTAPSASPTADAAADWLLPRRVPLPTGFQPEGIAIGPFGLSYVGSTSTGAIYRYWAVTGGGDVLVPPREGRSAIGLALRGGRLFVAGGATGQASVYDRFTGDELARYQVADPDAGTFVNDVVVTDEAAWFTDSLRPVLYRVPVRTAGAAAPAEVEEVPLTGDLVYQEGFNLNGIDATAGGEWLVVAQSNTGRLFRVDPATGDTTAIAVRGEGEDDVRLTNADGILLRDGRLWVVRNRDNEIVELAVDADLSAATVVRTITDPRFDVPTTIAPFLGRLYAVNARFGTPEPATAEYSVVAVRR